VDDVWRRLGQLPVDNLEYTHSVHRTCLTLASGTYASNLTLRFTFADEFQLKVSATLYAELRRVVKVGNLIGGG